MVGNGGRQEGSLLKTPFYVDLHDTKHKSLQHKNTYNQPHKYCQRNGHIKNGSSDKITKLTLVPPVGFVIMPKIFDTDFNAN